MQLFLPLTYYEPTHCTSKVSLAKMYVKEKEVYIIVILFPLIILQ